MNDRRYVYAIVRQDSALPPDRELALVPWRGLAAVTGHAPSTRRADADLLALAHHEAVVEAVRRHAPALPVRFGSVLPDAATVASAIAERYDVLAADLERVGDKVEMSLTALWAAPPTEDGEELRPDDGGTGAGARYLRARAAAERRHDALRAAAQVAAGEVDAVLHPVALDRRVALLPTPRIAVRAAYLLAPGTVEGFIAALEAFRQRHGELRVLLTGPWAPYSFVSRTHASGGVMDGGLPTIARLLTTALQERRG